MKRLSFAKRIPGIAMVTIYGMLTLLPLRANVPANPDGLPAWHDLPASAPLQNSDAFEAASLKKNGFTIAAIAPRYKSTYFSHIWAGGYAARTRRCERAAPEIAPERLARVPMRAKRKCNLRRKGKTAMLDFGNTRNRANFHMLVRTVILKAAYVAATACGANVPRRLQIAIVGSQRDGTYVDIADVTDVLFRDDGLVARRIDVSVGNIRGDFADVRIVVAEPEAGRFDESYNSPKGYGPFRVVHWLASDRMTGT